MPFFYFPIAFLSILLIIIYLFIFGVSFFSVPPTNQLNRTLNLKVGASLGGQHSDAGRVAGLAEDVSIQRVAALVISFRQEATTILTPVAVNMEITIQSHNSDSLLLAGGWHDRLLAHRTSGGKFLVEVLNAVDEATSIHGEWDPIQATVAHHTGEAVRMVGLPGGSENPLHDGLGAYTALLQGINVAGLTVGFLLHGVEGLPPELAVADDARETIHMEDLVHGSASCPFPNDIFPTASTAAKVFVGRWIFHVIQHLLGQVLQFIFRAE